MHQEYQYVKSSWLVYDYDMKAPIITKMKTPIFCLEKVSSNEKTRSALLAINACLFLPALLFYGICQLQGSR